MTKAIDGEWRQVPGYDGFYDITPDGQVRSWRGHGGGPRRTEPRLLSPGPNTRGYPIVYMSKDGVARGNHVHRIVLETFVGPAPAGTEGCHNDGNPANCHLSNLRWDTRAGNMRDKVAHGKSMRGEAHCHAKLMEREVLEISDLLHDGAEMAGLARAFGVHVGTIQSLKSGRNWGWLTGRAA